ncbi:MAG: BMP family ABC transporter substrate-binding protein [Oscillibacter sp.]|jgi:basic membrane protein A|nr:BMP family ABC transporter substrate-binding protein [Oscillibacter sp.]
MKKFLALLLAALMSLSLVACGNSGSGTASSSAAASGKDTGKSDFKVGVILIGDENEGYTAAHIEGVKAAQQALGLTDDQIIYKYNIPEDETCYDTATDLVEQGCKVIFANSFSHESYILQAAQENPDVIFCHATGTKARTAGLKNFCNYFENIYEARYVSGIVAGLKLKELMDAGKVKDPYVGYVGAFPYAEVVSGYTAFFLGIRSIVPDAHMDVQYTNSWFDITAEGEAANALMAKGCVIIGQHADSTGAPSAVESAFKQGKTVFSVGYNVDMLSVAPDVALTSPQNNWGVLYTELIKTAMEGGEFKTDYCGGYSEDAVQISKLGTACAAGTEEAVNTAIAAIKDGSLHVFDTKTFTVGGKEVTNAFATDTDGDFTPDADEAIIDGYYHESYFQSAPSFTLRIDGIKELNAK